MADAWTEKCYKLLHTYILKYTQGTDLPPQWVAGLISVECARLDPKASRFESHVYESVMWVKKGNKSTSFPGFNSGRINQFIKGHNDIGQLKSLATSYGLGQLMGYHYVNKWGLEPEVYTNLSLEESVKYTVLFMLDGLKFCKEGLVKNGRQYGVYEQLMRWHNTGSTTGTTYHPDYVVNAINKSNQYFAHMESMMPKDQPETKFPEMSLQEAAKFLVEKYPAIGEETAWKVISDKLKEIM